MSTFLCVQGQVWAAGNNNYGQLGLGDIQNRHQFTHVRGLTNIVTTETIYNEATLFLDDEGQLWFAGHDGELSWIDMEKSTPGNLVRRGDISMIVIPVRL